MQKICAMCRFGLPILDTNQSEGEEVQYVSQVECRRFPVPCQRPADYGCGEWQQREAEQLKPPDF